MPEKVLISDAPIQTATTIGAEGIKDAARQGSASKDKELLEMLQKQHPLYRENFALWNRTGMIALNQVVLDSDKRRLLIKGDAEGPDQFKKRVELSKFLPETPSLLSDFIGAVFSKPAQRKFQEPEGRRPADKLNSSLLAEKIKLFFDAAGMQDQPMTRVTEDADRVALVYGSCDGVLDHPRGDPTELPKIVLYTPLQRVDWEDGADGNFEWVKYHERSTEQSGWSGKRRVIDDFRIYTAPSETGRGTIRSFRVVEDEVEEFPEIEHFFPSMPVRTLYWHKVLEGVGDPWVKALVEGDVKIFRQESDLTWDVFVHAHPWVILWLNEKRPGHKPLDDINPGQNWALHLDPGGEERQREDIRYEAPPTPELMLQMDLIKTTREHVRRLAGNGSDTAIVSAPESGVAIAYRNAQRAKNFVQMARADQEWEWQLVELVASEGADEMQDVSGILTIKYPDTFDQRLAEELTQDLETASQLGSTTLVAEVSKRLAAKMLGDGASQEEVETVNAEIDAALGIVSEEEKKAKEDEARRRFEATNSRQRFVGDGDEELEFMELEEEEVEGGLAQIELNELTLGVERIARIGDFDMANILRKKLAELIGVPPPSDLKEKDVVTFRRDLVPDKPRRGAEVIE